MRKTCGKWLMWLQVVTAVVLFFFFTSEVNGRRRCGKSLKNIKLPAHTKFARKQRKANHVTLMCDKGYYFNKGNNIKHLSCKILRNISNYEVPKCRGCGKPPELRNGTVKYLATSVGSVAVYRCNVGFSIKGSRKQRKCRKNLLWSGGKSRITCQKNKCPDPGYRRILNGNVTFSDTLFEEFTTISFECDENYELFGEEDIVCLHGSWSTNRRPFCRKKRCPRPSQPQHGRIFGNNFFIGSTVEFFCNSGFTLYGSRKITCQDDKTWSGTVAVCDDGRSYCQDPGSPVGAIKSGKAYNEGDVVYYTCKNGLKLFQGSKNRTCLNNKTWSGEPPKCVDKDFKVFRSINETAELFGEGFVNSLLQTTCSGTNVSCPKYDTRARTLNLKYKDGLDLIFVLDTSSSITEKNFDIAKEFVKTIVDIFGVDRRPDGTRIACVTYGTRAEVHFTFTAASVETKEEALDKIDKIKYTRGGTATRLALDKVRKVILPSSNRPGSTKAMFIVTDGESNVGGSPKKAANYLKNQEGVEIYVIGIGKKVRDESLRSLASKDENIFPIKSYKDLNKVKKKIVKMPLKDFSECGRSPFKPFDTRARIVGGRVADERNSNWPWAVSITSNEKPLCGGTLISQEFVLTAAHCLHNIHKEIFQPHNVRVVFQERKRGVLTSNKLYIHPDYNQRNYKNDIALIKIPKLKRFRRNQQAICLPREMNTTNIIKNSNEMYVVGWGRTTPRKPSEIVDDEISEDLKEVKLPFQANQFCEDNVKNKTENEKVLEKDIWYFNSTTQFCAGDLTGQNDACQGDSGGPAMVLHKHPESGNWRWFQVGIVSWGVGCAQKGEAGFYTKVSAYIDWIDQIMKS